MLKTTHAGSKNALYLMYLALAMKMLIKSSWPIKFNNYMYKLNTDYNIRTCFTTMNTLV